MSKVAALLAGVLSAATLTPASTPPPTCRDVAVPVTMPLAGTQTVAGSLCFAGSSPAPTVQILLAGATYNRSYWDFPYQSDTYSYVRRATAAGYTTLALDRPGTGASSHPPGLLLTNASEASAVHQVVNAARLGKFGAVFTRVLLAGHSYGSVVAWYEAATYADVDALLVTGMAHEVQPAAAVPVATSLVPQLGDPTYLTTRPGTRQVFWHGPHDDPAVIAADEATKDTVTTSELADTVVAQANGTTDGITVPVLAAVGQQDLAYANALAHEPAHYPHSPCVSTYRLPDAGHDLNLAPYAPDWFTAAVTWANRVLGATGGPPRC
ncbi:alpha/beta hydrolase [Kutzneria buriramensis]|uniref:Alpha-beta hydrolase superfamily lysophospholipase n=1 Tax=Kutzneria buriramensis TaxID=1045776 RepID=A0A3E0I9G6_9PSEU|nr:alpha/beta fold hydrolase [Kutzneria buriramensis]REH55251.1 alpha-beta hydrolase superfamily lysophospholipase [Kutzneria buriramensis]